jgi:hypothetical protein
MHSFVSVQGSKARISDPSIKNSGVEEFRSSGVQELRS